MPRCRPVYGDRRGSEELEPGCPAAESLANSLTLTSTRISVVRRVFGGGSICFTERLSFLPHFAQRILRSIPPAHASFLALLFPPPNANEVGRIGTCGAPGAACISTGLDVGIQTVGHGLAIVCESRSTVSQSLTRERFASDATVLPVFYTVRKTGIEKGTAGFNPRSKQLRY
ncbi:hypothetical protein BDV96DRAFT_130782 [Lophiotrema nucula]|uniref:Uncharacterized protein n=1 Tax=Lophiotrema nucula TaxID=690887 RepID=A0A6A5ZSL2_9PLEO|nr:hypothetical protein BDV96DRAFT_130782 [Lophiotrema nucula]